MKFNLYCCTFQDSHSSQLDLIAELIEKHQLKADKSCHKKNEVWSQIHEDYVDESGSTKTKDQIKKMWNNHMTQLRKFKRKIDELEKRTGNDTFTDTNSVFFMFVCSKALRKLKPIFFQKI